MLIPTTRLDHYQYLQGKAYAIDVLASARSTLSEPSLIGDLLKNLEDGCANKPASFAEGIKAITLLVRISA